MRHSRLVWVGSAMLAPLLCAMPALAQRAGENAAASADDAFGTQVGSESTGIYNEQDTRGLSPLKAGNARLDGIYFDPVASISGRTRASYGIRVGIAAIDAPFAAPTGIVDNKLRTAGDKRVISLTLTRLQYGGELEEFDVQLPIVKGHLSLVAGVGRAITNNSDGGRLPSIAYGFKPVLRFDGVEISPFIAGSRLYDIQGRPLFVTTGAIVPPVPAKGHYLGQTWARGQNDNLNMGATVKAALSPTLGLRAGLFRSSTSRKRNFTEIVSFSAPGSLASHRLISDPPQDLNSVSGEAQLALRIGDGAGWQSRVIAGFRFRKRYTESGGGDVRSFGSIDINGTDPEPEPVFSYGPVNIGRLTQTGILLGYQGRLAGKGSINLGLQRARYRASFLNAASGLTTQSRDDAWLYNASFAVNLTGRIELFGGTQTGLEDSGAAPENAANRNEQLPTTRSKQYEAGLRWKFGQSVLVMSLFQITRPYFSFDAGGRFVELGTARYRGAELSLAAHLDRLTLIAGAVAMKPTVSGPGRLAGLVGERPAGTPDLYGRIDLQYRTDLWGGITPTATFIYTGSRAVGSVPVAALGGGQSMLPAAATLDLGFRTRFTVARVPASFRMTLQNIWDRRGWKVLASNVLQPDEGRRLTFAIAADF